MGETEQRLEQYGRELDREVHPVGLVDIAHRVKAEAAAVGTEATPTEPERRGRPKWWIAVAAAVLAIVLFLPALAYRMYSDSDAAGAGEEATSTTEMVDAEETTETTEAAPPTTSASESGREVLPNASGEWSVETSLGTFTWTRLEGDHEAVPEYGIVALGDGFIAVDEGGTWVSEDGVAWERGELSGPFADSWVNVMEVGDNVWAFANDRDAWDTQPRLYRMEGENWEEVALPEAVLPEIEGITWQGGWPGRPVAANGVTLMDYRSWGSVDWGAVYGTFPITDPGAPEDIPDQPPWPEWDEVSETVRIRQPNGEQILGVLTVELVDGRIAFRDVDTGEVVITVGSNFPGATPEEVVDYIVWGGYTHPGLIVDTGGGFTVVDAPWAGPGSEHVEIAAVNDGFVALVLKRDPPQNFENPDAELIVWRSANGTDWELVGSPQVTEGTLDWMTVAGDGERLVMSVVESTQFEQSASLWTSADGVAWERAEVDLGMGHPDQVYATDFGFVLLMMSYSEDSGAEFYDVWLSADGVDWERVSQSPEVTMNFAGGMGGQVAGNVVFVSRFADGGGRTLWIGRLEG
jgi:hypothetical protein